MATSGPLFSAAGRSAGEFWRLPGRAGRLPLARPVPGVRWVRGVLPAHGVPSGPRQPCR